MNRSDRLGENAVVHELAQLERDFHEFTASQGTSGASGLETYLTSNLAEWDLVLSLGSSADTSYQTTRIEVTYTSNGSQDFPIENIFGDVRCNGTALGNRPQYSEGDFFLWTDTTRSVIVDKWMTRDESLLTSPTQYRWFCDFSHFKDVTLYFKAVAAGTCPGVLSVVRVP